MIRILAVLLLVFLVGGIVVLALRDWPAPTEPKEIMIPNERFERSAPPPAQQG